MNNIANLQFANFQNSLPNFQPDPGVAMNNGMWSNLFKNLGGDNFANGFTNQGQAYPTPDLTNPAYQDFLMNLKGARPDPVPTNIPDYSAVWHNDPTIDTAAKHVAADFFANKHYDVPTEHTASFLPSIAEIYEMIKPENVPNPYARPFLPSQHEVYEKIKAADYSVKSNAETFIKNLKQEEINAISERLYDEISKTVHKVAKEVEKETKKTALDVWGLVDDSINKTVDGFLESTLGEVQKYLKDHKEIVTTAALGLGHQLFEMAKNKVENSEELNKMKDQFKKNIQDQKRIEAAKKANACIFTPTPGCQEEVKKLMDELEKEDSK